MDTIIVNGKRVLDEMLPRDRNTINKWFELEGVVPKKVRCPNKVLSWICRKHDMIQNFEKRMEGSGLSVRFIRGEMRSSINGYDAFIDLFRR